jgi:hypothetical protein
MKRPWDAIAWWEKRRILFNIVVLVSGILSALVIEVIGARFASPGEDVEEPIGIVIAAVAYAIAANLCYSLGWITELLWSGGDTARTEAFRPRIFRLGIIVSIVLTLLPGILIPLAWVLFGFK